MDAIGIRTALDKDFRPLRGDFVQTLMIELTPQRGMSTLPLNLGILLDVSGSMEGAKLENAKQACNLLLAQLKPQDRAAVCVFSSGARTIVPSQMFDSSVNNLAQREVARLQIEGATELLAGLNQVYAEVAPHRSPDVTTFVILLSDGEPTDSQGYRVKSLDGFLEENTQLFDIDSVSTYFAREELPVRKDGAIPALAGRLWSKIRKNLKEVCEEEAYCLFNPYIRVFDILRHAIAELAAKDDRSLPRLRTGVNASVRHPAESPPRTLKGKYQEAWSRADMSAGAATTTGASATAASTPVIHAKPGRGERTSTNGARKDRMNGAQPRYCGPRLRVAQTSGDEAFGGLAGSSNSSSTQGMGRRPKRSLS